MSSLPVTTSMSSREYLFTILLPFYYIVTAMTALSRPTPCLSTLPSSHHVYHRLPCPLHHATCTSNLPTIIPCLPATTLQAFCLCGVMSYRSNNLMEEEEYERSPSPEGQYNSISLSTRIIGASRPPTGSPYRVTDFFCRIFWSFSVPAIGTETPDGFMWDYAETCILILFSYHYKIFYMKRYFTELPKSPRKHF